jgi:D-alanyl-D-alanine carboxypeptidase
MDASEIEVSGTDEGRMALANGFANHGEPVRRTRGKSGKVEEIWLGGSCFRPEAAVVAELEGRYGKPPKTKPATARSRAMA